MNLLDETEAHYSLDGLNGAILSKDAVHRYALWRTWAAPGELQEKGLVKFVMLNPSTADHLKDDATIRKCVKFAKTWGYKGLVVLNLFAFRATQPEDMKKAGYENAVGRWNDHLVLEYLQTYKGPVVAAWGQGGKFFDRAKEFREFIGRHDIKLKALKLSKDGTPCHPLYLKDNSQLFDLEK